MACRVYVILTVYLAQQAPWTRTLRELAGAGASIDYKDELSRRIVARIDPERLEAVLGLLEGRLAAEPVVEVKAYCRGVDVGRLSRRLAELGFRRVPGPRGRTTSIGIVNGRLVFVEAWGRRATVKVGARTRSARPPVPPPPSAFQHHPLEAPGVVGEAAAILGLLGVDEGA